MNFEEMTSNNGSIILSREADSRTITQDEKGNRADKC